MKLETLKRILAYTAKNRRYLVFALLSALVHVAMTLWAPVLIGDAVDGIVGAGDVDFGRVGLILLVLLANVLLAALFQLILTRCTNRLAYQTARDMRSDLYDRLHSMPLSYLDAHAHGELLSRMVNDVDLVADGLLQGFSQVFTGVVTIVGTIGFMLAIDYRIALVVIVLTPLSLFAASFIAKHSYRTFSRQAQARGELSGLAEEMITNQKVVRAFGYEKAAQTRFDAMNQELYSAGVRAMWYASLTNPTTRLINAIVYAAVGVAGAIGALYGQISVGGISAFLSYANQYTKPFNEITGVLAEFQNSLASARRVFDVLDAEPEPDDSALAALPAGDGSVKLENVWFSYRKDKPLIENLNLSAGRGQRIAIVGPTGCGKTTIINLLMRFYDVDQGRILVNDTDISRVTRASLRSQYGMVLQETWLFGGSIADNIAYGRPDASRSEIEQAARRAHAHSFIMRLPDGYDTVIDSGASGLSAGQRQLLCIARVMLTRPPMLILDEATSSIDTRTEAMIQEAFLSMMQGRTSFIVAHRLSTIREADTILVMRDGHVIEQGNHVELLKLNGFYARLYNSQFDPEDSDQQENPA